MKKSNLKGNGCKWQMLPFDSNAEGTFCMLRSSQSGGTHKVDLKCNCSFYKKGQLTIEEYLNPPHHGIG